MNQSVTDLAKQYSAACATSSSLCSPETDLWQSAGGLREYWYIACTSAELKTDKPRSVTLMGRRLVLFRNQQQQPTAMIDQCVHRAALLSKGTLKDGCLSCPYHGWCYNDQGQVMHIPSVDGLTTPQNPHPFKQKTFAGCEQDGVIWVYLGDQDPAQRPVYKMPFYQQPGYTSYYMTGVYAGDLSSIAQINMDVPHTVFVHGKLFRSTAGKRLKSSIEIKADAVEVTYRDNQESLGPLPWLINPRHEPLVHTDRYFAPNITQVDYHWGDTSNIVFVSVISPIDAHTSRLYTCISYKFPFPKLALKTMRPMLHVYTKLVNQQDIAIMHIRQRGEASAPVLHQHSVRADMAHVAIDKILHSIRHNTPFPKNMLGVRSMNFEI